MNDKQQGLLVDDSDLLAPVLAALGGGLRQLAVFNASRAGHSWV